MSGIVSFGKLPGNQLVAQSADLVLVEVSQGIAQLLRRRVGAWDQAMTGQLIEDRLVVRIQRAGPLSLYIDCAVYSGLC